MGIRAAVVVLVAMLLVSSSSASAQAGGPGVPELDLAASDTVRLVVPVGAPDRWQLELPLGGHGLTLQLARHSLRAPGFRVLAGGLELVDHTAPPVQTYRHIGGRASAAVTLGEDGVRAVVHAYGEWWFVQPAPGRGRGEHLLYRAGDIDAPEMACQALRLFGEDSAPLGPESIDADCQRIAEIAFDADTEYFALNGSSVDATVADIESVLNAVDLVYNQQLAVGYSLTTVIVRTEEPDPYSAQTMAGLLNVDMASEWTGNLGDIPRDIAHLMTGRGFGNIIGIAIIGDVCSQFSLGVSRSRWSNNWGLRTSLTVHELGHNWNAEHCNGESDCGVMCSGIGGCAGDPLDFGRGSTNAIMNYRAGRACLDPAPGLGQPTPPIALDDVFPSVFGEPVLLDVLANDLDPNCEPVDIGWFDPVTLQGGTISLSPGSGPDGRDELLYTPPPGLTEPDAFLYAAGASGGVSEPAEVVVEFFRRPENPHPVIRGLALTYYDLGFRTMPVIAELTPVASGPVFDLDFPPSQGLFAGSGRANNLAATISGPIAVQTAGLYTFYLSSDEGSKLRVNNAQIIDHDGRHPFSERSGEVWLDAGRAELRVEYYELEGDAGLRLEIEGPGLTRQVVGPSIWACGAAEALYYAVPTGAGEPVEFAGRGYPVLGTGVVNARFNHFFLSGREIFDSGYADDVGVLFDGYLQIAQSDRYSFFLNTGHGDGATLRFGTDPLVTTLDGSNDASISLLKGRHKFDVSWAALGGSTSIDSVTINIVDGAGNNQGSLTRESLLRPSEWLGHDVGSRIDPIEVHKFFRRFGSGHPAADLNADGRVDVLDIIMAIDTGFRPRQGRVPDPLELDDVPEGR